MVEAGAWELDCDSGMGVFDELWALILMFIPTLMDGMTGAEDVPGLFSLLVGATLVIPPPVMLDMLAMPDVLEASIEDIDAILEDIAPIDELDGIMSMDDCVIIAPEELGVVLCIPGIEELP